ncbi:chitinase [Streptomyces sp. NPDC005808]|uniref:chitinase n=1 Tax=Streptomyces sp. NPDC005808 TaxID=3364734 RepID=UPI00368ACBBF
MAALTAGMTGASSAEQASAASFGSPRTMPAHVFAPYFQSYRPGDPAALAEESGASYLTMAFVQTEKPGSCDPLWNGLPETPISASVYGKEIAKLRSRGGDVAVSFGGGAASGLGTDIADSCTDVSRIAAAYEKVITTYGVTRLDLDVEGTSLNNTAGVDRRNKAIALVDEWAKRTHREVQFGYTLPSSPTGLEPNGKVPLTNAVANGADIDLVNIMTFDYWDGKQHDMAADTFTAADSLVATLKEIYPDRNSKQLWGMVGVTEMIGLDDYGCCGETGPPEIFTLADAEAVTKWAGEKGIASLSFWALGRDNGDCPGVHDGTCSGVEQSEWDYTRTMRSFTHR